MRTLQLPPVSRSFKGLMVAVLCCHLAVTCDHVAAQGMAGEPVVARVQMQLKKEDEILDVIQKGDLLTVIAEREKSYSILTYNGHRGAVAKVNALRLAEAVEIYTDLIEEDPTEGRLYILRAPAWWARGNEEEALADYDKAIELGYNEAHAYSSRGLFHASLGNLDKAIADYTTAIEKGEGDDDETALINRAAVYMTQGKHQQAIDDYTAAIELDPKKASSYQQRAVAWKLSGELPRAIEDFTKSLEIAPQNIPALMGRGFVWYQLEKSERAVADFSKVIELDPKNAEAYNNRGYNRQLLGEYEVALADYDKAIELSPEHRLAYQNKAWLLSGADDESIRDGKAAITAAAAACKLSQFKDLGDVKALAAALAEDGQFDKAIGWQEQVVKQLSGEAKEFEMKMLEKYRDRKPFRIAEL